jgi:hypothetical protein
MRLAPSSADMTTMRFGIAFAGLAMFALGGAGCDLKFDFEERELDERPPQDTPAQEPPRMCTPVVAEATPEYEMMCRHYCGELEATLTYAGVNREAAGATAQSCYELRCAPRCVSVDTCAQQCHALGVQYQTVCAGVEPAPDTICPVSIDERVNACLAGCGVPVKPPPPPDPPPPDVESRQAT